jgi:WD40 repeat protein
MRVLVILLLAAGCGRGLQGNPHPLPSRDAASDALLDAPVDPPVTDAAAPLDSAPVLALEAGAPDARPEQSDARPGPSDARPDVAPPPLLPATTSWTACGHLGGTYPSALKHSPDGAELLVGYPTGDVDVFRAAGGDPTLRAQENTVVVEGAYSSGGALMATLDIDRLRIWSRTDAGYNLSQHSLARPRRIQFSPVDPHLILIAGDRSDSNVQVWQVGAPADYKLTRIHGFSGPPDVAFSSDGTSLVMLDGQAVKVTDLDGASLRSVDLGGTIAQPVFAPDGSMVVGLDPDGSVVGYGVARGERRWTGNTGWGRPERLFLVGNPSSVLAVSRTRTALFVASDGTRGAVGTLSQPLFFPDPSPDGRELAGVSEDGKLLRLSLPAGTVLPGPLTAPPGTAEIFALSASPDGKYLGLIGAIQVIWDVAARSVTATLGEPQVEFSPGSDLYASSGHNCAIIRLDDGSAAPTPPPNSCSYGLVFAPGGALLAGVSESLGLNVFSSDGRVIKNLAVDVSQHPAVRFSPDGNWLASSDHRLWSTRDWSSRWTVDPPGKPDNLEFQDQADTVAWSPDSTRVLLTTGYGTGPVPRSNWMTTTTLVSVPDGAVLMKFPPGFPRQASFSPEGAWIVAGPQLLHLASGKRLTLDTPASVSLFLPDGRIAAAQPGQVVTFYCPR